MAAILLTQSEAFIIGDVAKILGWIMNVLFNFMSRFFGIENIGLCIIFFTIIIYILMLPLTIKQQKFSKFSAKMNPEIQAIQKKYKNKKDNASMMAMNEETKAVYEKYGVSPTGSCVQLLIQMPILLALYRVIMNVPAYVDGVKEVFVELADKILVTSGGPAYMEELKTLGSMNIVGTDYSLQNTIIDVLYRLQDTGNATWDMLIEKFPSMTELITSTQSSINSMNNFGINIANSPMNIIKAGFSTGAYGMMIGGILVPVLAAVSQMINFKMMPQTNPSDNDSMNATMKSMNLMMPFMSAWFCLMLPTGMGIYWIAGALIRGVQQFAINKYIDRLDFDAIIKKNIEKSNRIREKKGEQPKDITNVAKANVRSIDSGKKKEMTEEEKEEAVKKATEFYKNADKPGSLASKAAMVARYNEKTKKN